MEMTEVRFVSVSQRRLVRVRRGLIQTLIVGLVVVLVAWLCLSVRSALAAKGIQFSFGYLWTAANLSLSEGWTVAFDGLRPVVEPFSSSDTNAEALVAGLSNSLKVAIAAIVFSTVFGTLVGIGRLSGNWLVRNLSFGLVECVRNTPLLIQIVFWYFAVVLKFPPANAASHWLGSLIASQAGVFLPGLTAVDDAQPIAWLLVIGAAASLLAAFLLRRRAAGPWLCVASVIAVAASVWLGFPVSVDLPVSTRFGATGGIALTPEFTAILLAIVVNSSAYVAEIVRGAIDAMPRGQWEAASALGLSRSSTLRDIILPQVFRVVLPSLGNRYISLTKDTSLGIAIGYPDLFNVYGTVSNQTGRNLEGVLIVILTYLILSWAISAGINIVIRRVNTLGGAR